MMKYVVMALVLGVAWHLLTGEKRQQRRMWRDDLARGFATEEIRVKKLIGCLECSMTIFDYPNALALTTARGIHDTIYTWIKDIARGEGDLAVAENRLIALRLEIARIEGSLYKTPALDEYGAPTSVERTAIH